MINTNLFSILSLRGCGRGPCIATAMKSCTRREKCWWGTRRGNTNNGTGNGTVDLEDVLAGNTIGAALAASVVTCHDDDISVALERWKVKSVLYMLVVLVVYLPVPIVL